MMKRLLSLTLALLLLSSLVAPAVAAAGLNNFQKIYTYETGQFEDVPSTEWFDANVKTAYEFGLMKGKSASSFVPNGNVTIAETLAIACRLHHIYHGGSGDFEQGTPWYQVYAEYAIANSIIKEGTFPSYTVAATRAEFAEIIANSVPSEALSSINTISAIPDVPEESTYGKNIYQLYRAGILTGNDEYGTFSPQSNIKRSEVSAIVTRVAVPNLRKSVSLKEQIIPATSIYLNKTSLFIPVGGSKTLIASINPLNTTDKTISWTSSDPKVVTVSNGKLNAVSSGTATITATCGNVSASCTVRTSKLIVPENPFAGPLVYYEGYEGLVPDFGKVLGIEPKSPYSYSIPGQYYYRASDAYEVDPNARANYINLLSDLGFYHAPENGFLAYYTYQHKTKDLKIRVNVMNPANTHDYFFIEIR